MSSISVFPAASWSSRYGANRWATGSTPTPADDLARNGPFPLSVVTNVRLPRVTTPPDH
ncbi:hypothetical protein HMPREF1550_00299 [Actinomyces sp. oral taxon 877 str. F0543]|nr:hypothetical protein HMPREF1550_00299 [Actinomyces sp. oral taxon 877 str. F0543]